jgi:hypothetical protein
VIRPPEEPAAAEPPPSLYEASLRARAERAAQGERAAIVVTDETLQEQARRGQLTVAKGAPPDEEGGEGPDARAAASGDAGPAGSATAVPQESSEAYWRRRVRDARLRWREAVDQARELEEEAARLRWEFYATDDGYYRDSQVKPAWDRAIEELELARDQAEFERRSVELVLEEGRRAGALPGWLREGLDLEPAEEEAAGPPPELVVGEPVEAEVPDGRQR